MAKGEIKDGTYATIVDGTIEIETTSTGEPCPHDKGWYDSIGRWWGRQNVFVCEKCMTILDTKWRRV